ncbi:MAG TPA: BamA/TamA family outer membrane protein [Polyangiaceae bacterium]|jgi:outer membrane protein assembly factor BamA
MVLSAAIPALTARAAHAADPLNSSDRAPLADDGKGSGAHDEFNLVPVAGGTTDIGIGGGYFLGLTRVKKGVDPYVWDLESGGFVTFAPGTGGGVILPYQDVYVDFVVPRFLGHPLRLEIRPEYSWETTLGYYGLGNAATDVAPQGAPARYFEYGRLHPYLPVDLRWRLVDHLAGHTGLAFEQSWLQVAPESKLAADLRDGSPEVKHLLGSTSPNGVMTATWGLQWDNRDDAVSSHRGMFHTLDVKLSPGGAGDIPYRYAQVTAVARGFVPLWGRKVVFAGRLVGDALVGDPPFYELSRFNDGYTTYAIGGLNGVRGVPAQRYYGKVKAFGNAELRTEIASFHALGKPVIFGLVAFLDAGRVWADTSAQPDLDGHGVGLKYGAGGGVRFQSGSAFVLRGDVAYSPDAKPIGGYVAAGQMF